MRRVFLSDPYPLCRGGYTRGRQGKSASRALRARFITQATEPRSRFAHETRQIKITRRNKLGYVSRRAYSSVTLYNNFTEITVKVLNKLLANQQVSITQSELEQLIK